jgi:hypothetical protein
MCDTSPQSDEGDHCGCLAGEAQAAVSTIRTVENLDEINWDSVSVENEASNGPKLPSHGQHRKVFDSRKCGRSHEGNYFVALLLVLKASTSKLQGGPLSTFSSPS